MDAMPGRLTVAIARYRTARRTFDELRQGREQAEETYYQARRAAVEAAVEVEKSRKALLNVVAES